MQIETGPWHLDQTGTNQRRDASAEQGRPGSAWQLEMDRANQAQWRCDAFTPVAAITQFNLTHFAEAATAGPVHSMGVGRDFVAARPYGIEGAVAAQSWSGTQPREEAKPFPQVLKPDLEHIATNIPMHALGRERGRGMLSDALSLSSPSPHAALLPRGGAAQHAAVVPMDRSGAAMSELAIEPQRNPAPHQASVRLHVEQGKDGRMNAWLGVDDGAGAQAAAVVAALREDARRRGSELGVLHINGKALADIGQEFGPDFMPAYRSSQAGEH